MTLHVRLCHWDHRESGRKNVMKNERQTYRLTTRGLGYTYVGTILYASFYRAVRRNTKKKEKQCRLYESRRSLGIARVGRFEKHFYPKGSAFVHMMSIVTQHSILQPRRVSYPRRKRHRDRRERANEWTDERASERAH